MFAKDLKPEQSVKTLEGLDVNITASRKHIRKFGRPQAQRELEALNSAIYAAERQSRDWTVAARATTSHRQSSARADRVREARAGAPSPTSGSVSWADRARAATLLHHLADRARAANFLHQLAAE